MRRRGLILMLGSGVIARSIAARAQQKAMPAVGWLSPRSPADSAALVAGFRQGLAETGYVEGQNLIIEYRWAEGNRERLPALAADLVSSKVDVIATGGGPSTALAAKDAPSTIPIVFATGTDPVELGLVASLARPGRQPDRHQLAVCGIGVQTARAAFRAGPKGQGYGLAREPE